MDSLTPVLLLGLAGFSFGGSYALYIQRKPLWAPVLVGLFGLLCLVAGWLYL
jgi:hypothetical protein